MKTIIVILSKNTESQIRELIGAANTVSSDEISTWTLCTDIDTSLSLPVDNMLFVQADYPPVAERYIPSIIQLYERERPELLLFYGDCFGNELAATIGYLLGGSTAMDITNINLDENGIRINRGVYALNLVGQFSYKQSPYVFSIAKNKFEPNLRNGVPKVKRSDIQLTETDWYEDYTTIRIKEERGLDTFEVVLVGGRGIGSKANMNVLAQLADAMGAGIGATRPAILNSWLPMEKLVGISGTVIKPKLCITFGISGCAPFMKGIDKSQRIIAVNKDPEALIFDHCDVGIVSDCMSAIEEIRRIVDKRKIEK